MDHSLSIPSLAQRITEADRVLVGIDGAGATGKSTLAALLAEQIPDAHVVHVDDFYLPTVRHGELEGAVGALFDLPRLRTEVLQPAREGRAIQYRRYDWPTDALAELIEIPAGAPVIVEGVYCLDDVMRDAYSCSIWCHAPYELRLSRGLDRDGEDAREQWVEVWMPLEEQYAQLQHPDDNADLVLDSAHGLSGTVFTVVADRRD
ncbi:uridine kinase family protein [Flexivirga caeni]|nr:uridine kinase [Flexivirga caeni]